MPEADITASPAEFAAMVRRIAELVDRRAGEILFPSHYGSSALVVRIGSGSVVVEARAGGEVLVSGGPEPVGLFGRSLPAEPTLSPGYHVHFEHAGREWFVAAESVPLVLMVGSVPDADAAPDRTPEAGPGG